MKRQEIYLGDGLYASFDGYAIRLRAPVSGGDHIIYLEPDVFRALVEYKRNLRKYPRKYPNA